MRRDEHSMKGTGTLTEWLVTAVTGEGDTGITRLDRDVLWRLNDSKKEYTECPAHGCPPPPAKEEKSRPEARKEEPKQETRRAGPGQCLHRPGELPAGQVTSIGRRPADTWC
jgi:hypothetical protein